MTFKISVNSTKQQEDSFQYSSAAEAATQHSGATPQGELINSSEVTDVSKALPPAALVTSTETPAWQCGNHPWIAGESRHITCPKALKAVERNCQHSAWTQCGVYVDFELVQGTARHVSESRLCLKKVARKLHTVQDGTCHSDTCTDQQVTQTKDRKEHAKAEQYRLRNSQMMFTVILCPR